MYRVERREAADRAKRREEFYAGRRRRRREALRGELPPLPDPKPREAVQVSRFRSSKC